jgi:plasmid maintenance system antidote protein VapI
LKVDGGYVFTPRLSLEGESAMMTTAIDYNNDKNANFESIKIAAQVQNIFRAFKECSDVLQEHACSMFEIISNKETPEDEKQLAIMTLADILFPNPDREDGLLGMDLKRAEELGAAGSSEANEVLEKMDREEATFAERLREAMERRSVTQLDLAKRIGVTQPAISMMLQRECRPQRRTVVKLAEALGISPQDLWPGFQK